MSRCVKIPTISPGLIFVQNAFLADLLSGGGGGGLFPEGLIIAGSFALQNGLSLSIKTALNAKLIA